MLETPPVELEAAALRLLLIGMLSLESGCNDGGMTEDQVQIVLRILCSLGKRPPPTSISIQDSMG